MPLRESGLEVEFARTRVKKYGHVINIGIQNTLVYRVNFLFRSLFGLIPLFATISLWRAIYAGQGGEVGGYTLDQMVSYYLVMTLVDMFTAVAEDDWQIAADIKDGNISQFLLKPIDYLTYRLCLFGAGRLIYTSVALIPVALFILGFRDQFVLPADWATVGWFALSLVLTALLQFFISFTMALLAFWVLEVSTFIFIVFAFEYIAGGHMFPLDILPPALNQALHFTPFPYQLFFPVNIYLGRVTGDALLHGLLVQAAWVVAAYGLARFVGAAEYASMPQWEDDVVKGVIELKRYSLEAPTIAGTRRSSRCKVLSLARRRPAPSIQHIDNPTLQLLPPSP